ncbi:GNAT family N-acetyltransferase [Halomonas rhizosphaerae]|uniref:GNAT family N-acetyltransferase n=1 Tax=Halomonas rhizosphaerae TaxID=3043296 RepID=A0ABT6UYK8_9GAMM|nr:GNAT family N-acetyltransferase [Halomonas rhizosphaerae]MDI5890756.1 GNAT family N-acetyltransferase [Halomonas rhizosphaerae]MDI5921681.1 GNAT family N-acetyltransferase [Halomonas rhizosphaerae]
MIRPATREEFPQLVDIWLRASQQAHPFISEACWKARADDMALRRLPACEVQVLEAGRRVIGFCAMHGDHLEALFVDPEVQSFGHGSGLMAHAMEGHQCITLWVYSRNVRAVSFYRRLGFSIVDEREDPETGEQESLMAWSR